MSDRDFFMGTAVGDAAASDAYVYVNLNKRASYKIDLIDSAFASVLVGTAAAGAFGYPRDWSDRGARTVGYQRSPESGFAEHQGFARSKIRSSKFRFACSNDGSGTTPDLSLGIADGTHASDADSIAQSVFFHLDGKRPRSTPSATTARTRPPRRPRPRPTPKARLWRVASRVDRRARLVERQVLRQRCGVASGTTFSIAAASGTLFLLAHLEKTIGTDVYRVAVDKFRVRTGQQ